MEKKKPKIFLSYAHIDLGFAKKIYGDLIRYGLDVWFDKESLLAGQDWEREIKKLIRESDYFIALLSDNCLSKRGFVHSELKLSFEVIEKYFPADSGIFIIPVRLDDCKPSDAYERLGKIHWIDVFPEYSYQVGLKKILDVVNPGATMLRTEPVELTEGDAAVMIKRIGFYDRNRNPEGKGVIHQYISQVLNGDTIILDEATGLIWQNGGSSQVLEFEQAKAWIEELNQKYYAGFNDWRLPTLEEAMSLIEPIEMNGNLYIDPVFDSTQRWIGTADLVKGESWTWVVSLTRGECGSYQFSYDGFVRAVRSVQSSEN